MINAVCLFNRGTMRGCVTYRDGKLDRVVFKGKARDFKRVEEGE